MGAFCNFAPESAFARMAELVDALVSKTNGVNPVPVRFRLRVPCLNNPLFALKGEQGIVIS